MAAAFIHKKGKQMFTFFDTFIDGYTAPTKKNDKAYKEFLKKENFLTLLNMVASMFVWSGIPEETGIDVDTIEPTLLLTGKVAFVKEGNEYLVGRVSFAGEPTRYFYGRDAIATAGNGFNKYYKNWSKNKNIVVAFNNNLKTPDFQLLKTAGILSEVDISLLCNLVYSRLYPIGVAHDDKTKKVLEELFDNIQLGKFASITSRNILENLGGKDGAGIDVLNLTDVSVSDKIQYLAKYKDDTLRWLWSIYGQNVQATSKLAQESVDEVTSGQGVSMIVPHDMLHQRLRVCEELKKKFGWNVTVTFSEPWQNEFADCNKETTGEEPEKESVTDDQENNDGEGTGSEGGQG